MPYEFTIMYLKMIGLKIKAFKPIRHVDKNINTNAVIPSSLKIIVGPTNLQKIKNNRTNMCIHIIYLHAYIFF